VDRTDLTLFASLVSDALRSDAALARDVGLTPKAVRLRRRRMEAAGVLSDYGIHPAAEVLGRHANTWRYAGRDGAPLPLARWLEVEDLAYVLRFRPGLYLVVRFTTEAEPEPDPRLARLLGPPLDEAPDTRPPAPGLSPDRMSRVDWTVLEAMVRDPRAPYSLQARGTGVSPRTFRLRRARLEATHALACVMILNLEHEPGLPTYGIWLRVDGTFDERALERLRLWDRPHWTQHPRGVYLLGSAENYFEAREVELRLRALPGVVAADPLIPAGGWFARERFRAWIAAERSRRFGDSNRYSKNRAPGAG
jgi:DNA-binding Lrp family transcriptional regulator